MKGTVARLRQRPLSVAALCAIVIVAVIFVVVVKIRLKPFSLELRNTSGQTLRDVTVELVIPESDWHSVRKTSSLSSEGRIRLGTYRNDWGFRMQYTLNGESFEINEPHVELWRGETWLVRIMGDGSVQSGYGQARRSR